MNNVINILNIQGLGIKSDNLYDYKETLLYPASLLKIIITNYPYVFRNIIKSYGFNVDSWPTDLRFSVEDKSNFLLTIICPTVAQGGKKVNKLIKEEVTNNKGSILIISKDSEKASTVEKGYLIVSVSMTHFATEIIHRLETCNISEPKKENLKKLCNSWIVLGKFPKNLDFNKPIEQQDFVQFPYPWNIVSKLSGTVYDRIQSRLHFLIKEKIEAEINSGKIVWIKDKFMSHNVDKISQPLSCGSKIQYGVEIGKPFWNIILWKK